MVYGQSVVTGSHAPPFSGRSGLPRTVLRVSHGHDFLHPDMARQSEFSSCGWFDDSIAPWNTTLALPLSGVMREVLGGPGHTTVLKAGRYSNIVNGTLAALLE